MRGPWVAQPFLVPDDFRAFMKQVVSYLDAPSGSDTGAKFVDAEDALQDETGYGGRVDGADLYRFTYITSNGHHKWVVELREAAIREIADGLLIEVMGERFELLRTNRREPKGHPLLIWGEYGDDALLVRDHTELVDALDALHALAQTSPRMLRMWSAADDQVIAMMWQDDCALYVVESLDGYSTSRGEGERAQRTGSFPIVDHDGRPFSVPYQDCVPWAVARGALLQFIDRGDLGTELRSDGSIPSGLLMMGDVDREAALEPRAEPPRMLEVSSIPRLLAPSPPGVDEPDAHDSTLDEPAPPPLKVEELSAWARRLIEVLFSRELIELGTTNLDEITYHLGSLLQAHGAEAQHSLDTAEWLANEIGAVRGIDKLFATGGDLQIALRRSRSL